MEIKCVGVVGAGIMGSGIAQVCALAGLDVVMVDTSEQALERGRKAIAGSLARLVSKGKLAAADEQAALARIVGVLDDQALKAADIVIEAATENEALKLGILKRLDSLVTPEAIIATNTSSLSITKLAAATARPERFVGMHFFNPVPMMALVEIIKGIQTAEATHDQATRFAQKIGKTPISVRNHPGFAVNRILVPMINEAIFVLQEGLASAEQIDEGMKLGASHPIGPLALADLIGLETLLTVMEMFYAGFNDPKYRPAPLLKEMVDAGYLGRKTGRGFYNYS
jgi:3-hydroxybutyryl-CoA dehydrogenase